MKKKIGKKYNFDTSYYSKREILNIVIAMIVACIYVGIVFMIRVNYEKEKANTADITVQVLHSTGKVESFEYTSGAPSFGEAMVEEGLVSGTIVGENSLIIETVDGETAAEGSYWQLVYNGDYVYTNPNEIVMKDGDQYNLVYVTE